MTSPDGGPIIESIEAINQKEVVAYRVRHGETDYRQHTGRGGEIESDLTEAGEAQILKSAELIAEQIDPKRDVVFIANSSRIRARDTADIIRRYLREKIPRLEIYPESSEDKRSTQPLLQGTDLLDDAGNVVPTNTADHADIFEELNDSNFKDEYLRSGVHKNLESVEEVKARSRKAMARLIRVARHIQPRLSKRLVIILAEHEETLAELLESASGGERTMLDGTGPEKGEVIRLAIPAKIDLDDPVVSIKATSLQNPETTGTIDFNRKEGEFV